MSDVAAFSKFLFDNAHYGAMALSIAIGVLWYIHLQHDSWVQGQLRAKVDNIDKEFSQHVGGCQHDWEHQKVANEKAKAADDRISDQIAGLRGVLTIMEQKLDDTRNRLARIEGHLRRDPA